jgi:hypothetical protein
MSCFPVNDSEPVLCFPIDFNAPCPGATHATMEEAFTAGSESGNGTRSILDIVTISDTPTAPMAFSGVRTSYPIKEAQLQSIFGRLQPSHAEVQNKIVSGHPVSDEVWDDISRGTARHIVIFEDDQPTEMFFVGYSFD